MFFLRQGLNAPLVISPTTLPSAVLMALCCRAGAPVLTNPTRRLLQGCTVGGGGRKWFAQFVSVCKG